MREILDGTASAFTQNMRAKHHRITRILLKKAVDLLSRRMEFQILQTDIDILKYLVVMDVADREIGSAERTGEHFLINVIM